MESILIFFIKWFLILPTYIGFMIMPIFLLVAFAIGIFQEFRDALRGPKHSR